MTDLLEGEQKIKEFFKHFPKGHNKKIKKYVADELLIDSRYIFVYRKHRQQYGYCTHCKNEFKTDGLLHNKRHKCPNCKSLCTIKASGRGRKYLQDTGYFIYFEKSRINPKAIIARGIHVTRDYSGDYKEVTTELKDCAWYLFDTEEGSKMFKNPYWNSKYLEECKSIYSINLQFPVDTNLGICRTSIIAAVEKTPYTWSGWDLYKDIDIVKFFDLYTKYPCIEYLTKLGFKNLIIGKLKRHKTLNAVNWRGKDLFSVLKINKKELKEIKEKEIYVDFKFLKILQINKKDNWNLNIEEIDEMARNYSYLLDRLFSITRYVSGRKLLNYVERQLKRGIKEINTRQSILITWDDYIQDCIKLQRDITKDVVLFPKNLHTAHQNTIRQIKIKEDKELNIKIKKRLPSLKKFKFEYKGLMIRPAESSLELIDEGKALNHCVGTYAERYAKGKNILLFIRKINEPEKSYFTVEVKDNRIFQVRGKNNSNPDDAVKELIEVFKKTILDNKTNKVKEAISA